MKNFIHWIINRFSYIQIYKAISLLFLSSLLPIAYFWVQTHLELLDLFDQQIVDIRKESDLFHIYNIIQQHKLYTQRYLKEKNPTFLKKMQVLEKQMQVELEAKGINSLVDENSSGRNYWVFLNTIKLDGVLEEIASKTTTLSAREIESLHESLLFQIGMKINFLSERININYFDKNPSYVFLQNIMLRLSHLQEEIANIKLVGEKVLFDPSKFPLRVSITIWYEAINLDLNYYLTGFKFPQGEKNPVDQRITQGLIKYLDSITNLMLIVKNQIIDVSTPTISLDEFLKKSQGILQMGYDVWEDILKETLQIYEKERKTIQHHLWVVLFVTFVIAAFPFYLGLSMTYNGINRLNQLTKTTENFTNGQLSARVPDSFQDDIGRQSQAFNRMAQKLEGLIGHLYELRDSTTVLAAGDLSSRIQLINQDTEFEQVAVSFNKMAETFETIIGRLQQIGYTLTTTASEIASASKEQETIVVEQEATTREIAITANGISSTAKEFAITMNEVSLAADQTSDLALNGKGSLNNMESIMHNMVEASGKIANKLAVLNEKANNITSVITTISKVADQTNLLSLNASIEAEKAGEYGRSFSVIAREIRRLADQTAIATIDVENMVNEIMSAVSSSVIGVDDFNQAIRKGAEQVHGVGEQLATIIEQVQSFTARIEIVNQGMQVQSRDAEQINEAIAQLSQTARQTTEAIYQFHKTVQELNQTAHELNILNPFNFENTS